MEKYLLLVQHSFVCLLPLPPLSPQTPTTTTIMFEIPNLEDSRSLISVGGGWGGGREGVMYW